VSEIVHVLVHELADSWTGKHNKDRSLGLIALLEEHTQPVVMEERSEGGGGKVTGSPAPWAGDVEMLLADIDAGARDLEADLCRVLAWDQIERGGSRKNTLAALRRLPDLVDRLERENQRHWLVLGEENKRGRYKPGAVQKQLSTWHRQIRVVMGFERNHALLPYPCSVESCGEKALRVRPHGGVICGACEETYTDDELHEWFVPTEETA
jgi:hypothetical protein